MLQFAVTGMIAVLLLGFVAVTLLRHTGTTEAIRNAKQLTRLAGEGIVAPAITTGLARGQASDIAALDALVRGRVLKDPVVRVKIWDERGHILYSDEARLIGSVYRLKDDELAALRSGTAAAEVSDLSRPENRFERPSKKLLEVYLGVHTSDGQRLLFEGYERFSSISASGQRLWTRFLPALLGAMVLLELAQIPLAYSLARRLRKGQQEREALLGRAIEASDTERRRIAGILHDSAVQNLAGLSFGLSAAAHQLPAGSSVRDAVEAGAAEARRTMRGLRTLLVDIYPPVLQRSGLEAALGDLVRTGSANGPQITLEVPSHLELPATVEALVFRAAQEALRNVRSHSHARSAYVRLVTDAGEVVLDVGDDGDGFDAAEVTGRVNGHFGLRVLDDLAREASGHFTVNSVQGKGTQIRLQVPLA